MLNTIIAAIISAVLGWIEKFFAAEWAAHFAKKADEDKNKKATDNLEHAEAPKEREDAAKDIADNFGN